MPVAQFGQRVDGEVDALVAAVVMLQIVQRQELARAVQEVAGEDHFPAVDLSEQRDGT